MQNIGDGASEFPYAGDSPEMQHWCQRFGCTPAELRSAIQAVGFVAKGNETFLSEALPFSAPRVTLVEANQQLVLATTRTQAAEEELGEAARHKDEFLAMLGHELRNPLVPIRNVAEMLRTISGDNKQLTWAHEVLVRQVGHITRLVDDLLDISLISRGAMQLQLEPVDLSVAITRALDSVVPLVEKKRHRLHSKLVAMWDGIRGRMPRLRLGNEKVGRR
jgi:signal transduction histidine kinase